MQFATSRSEAINKLNKFIESDKSTQENGGDQHADAAVIKAIRRAQSFADEAGQLSLELHCFSISGALARCHFGPMCESCGGRDDSPS